MHVFKENVVPAWEDDFNAKGGMWKVELPKGFSSEALDQVCKFFSLFFLYTYSTDGYPCGNIAYVAIYLQAWLSLLCGVIGNTFEDGDDLCGCAVHIRRKGVNAGYPWRVWRGRELRDHPIFLSDLITA